jgi:dienelactone hydrolase
MRSAKNPCEKLLLIACVFLFLTACTATQVKKQSISLNTDDEKKLAADYYPANSPSAPTVILLPDTRCDKNVFGSFPVELNNAGFTVLSIDLRYKDLIAKAGSRDEAIKTIQKQNLYEAVDYDVKSAIDFLSDQTGASPARIGIIGTSFGSRVALLSGIKYDSEALVLVSLSGEEAFPGGKPVKQLLDEYGDKPILFMTCEKDWGGNYKAAEYNKLYYEWAEGDKNIKIWPGSKHGVEIVKDNEASEYIVLWLKSKL